MVDRRNFIKTAAMGAGAAYTAAGFSRVMGANEKLRIGVIGCGGMANSHMRALVDMYDSDNCEIVAVNDIYTKRMESAAELTGGRQIKDYRTLLEQKDIDYVLIATPEHWHYQMSADALDAGKHVYVEKPMTHKIEEARKLVAKVKSSDLKLQVGVQGTSDESYEVANRYIEDGALGKVVMAQIDYSRNYVGDFWAYDIDPDARPGVNLDWKAWLGPAPEREWDPRRYFQWRRYWDYSGGIATDLFIHRVTRILKSCDLMFPDYVVATGGTFNFTNSVAEIPDTFNVLADYPGGPTVVLISSMANDTPIAHVIRGHKATLTFTRDGFEITPQEATRDDVIPTGRDGEEKDSGVITYKKKGGERVDLHHRNLQNAIRFNEDLHCDCDLGYAGVVVCYMSVDSFRERNYLKWNKDLEKAEKA